MHQVVTKSTTKIEVCVEYGGVIQSKDLKHNEEKRKLKKKKWKNETVLRKKENDTTMESQVRK